MIQITTITPDGHRTVRMVPAGTKLVQIIDPAHLDTPCGGSGRCGKCRVRVQGQVSPPGGQELLLLGAQYSNLSAFTQKSSALFSPSPLVLTIRVLTTFNTSFSLRI